MTSGTGAPARELLRERRARLPGLLREAVTEPVLPGVDPRARGPLWTTGIGSSAGHARYLAEVLSRSLGLPARFVSTGRLAAGLGPEAGSGSLVVFSQGLSKNARFALTGFERWAEVFLVTAVTPDRGESTERDAERAAALEDYRQAGVRVVPFLGEPEFETLVRLAGPTLAYAAALRLAKGFGERLGRAEAVPGFDGERAARAVERAPRHVDEWLDAGGDLRALERGLVMVTSGGYGEAVQNLRTKVLEGVGCAAPALWDLLEFSHGGFQEFFDREATLVALSCADAAERPAGGFDSLASMRDPDRHGWLRLDSSEPLATAVFEHEAFFDAWLLAWLEDREKDPASWPGQGRDAPLYDRAPEVANASSSSWPSGAQASGGAALEASTWPEIEGRDLAASVAVVPLGSTEQHGGHLPFGTDTAIAEALAAGFCARVPGALRLPTLALGCADEHLGFAGTLSLRPSTLEAVIEDVLASLRVRGFERAFVFSAHGGNVEALARMAPARMAAAEPLEAIFFEGWAEVVDACHDLAVAEGIAPEAAGHHAGEIETSILASIAPGLVRGDRFEAGHAASRSEGASLFTPGFRDSVPSGVVGDPRGASAVRGARYLELWIDRLVAGYRAAKPGEKNRHHAKGMKKL